VRVVTFGESPDADYRVTGIATTGMATSLTIHLQLDNSKKRASATATATASATATATATPGAAAAGGDGNATGHGHGGQVTADGRSKPPSFGLVDVDLLIGVPGQHNALNAAAAFAAAVELGISPARAAGALASYRGAARRLEPKGEAGGVMVLDTYAHHPTELAADLRAARDIARGVSTGGKGRVIAVFQPHLYSRTRIFAAEFGAALGLADEAVVLDVYAAREDPEPGVTGRLVADAVPGGAARYVAEFGEVPGVVAALAAPGDLVLTMGAGDITRMGPLVLAEIAAAGAGAGSPGPGRP
jgi:UDP-N-acetylmuramate-alanine ligase